MKRLLQLLCCLTATILLPACSSTVIKRTETDGTTFKASNHRALWKSGGIDVSYGRTNTNVSASAKIDTSTSDPEAIKAIVDAAVKAALKAVVPAP